MSNCRTVLLGATFFLSSIFLVSCTGNVPATLGISDAGLSPCPTSPNCVSSDGQDSEHQVAPLQLAGSALEAWTVAKEYLSNRPRTRIVTEKPDYLHAECRSTLFGFVDDLELHLRTSEEVIAIRSASRLGYSDLGVNRRRVEELRSELISRGVVK